MLTNYEFLHETIQIVRICGTTNDKESPESISSGVIWRKFLHKNAQVSPWTINRPPAVRKLLIAWLLCEFLSICVGYIIVNERRFCRYSIKLPKHSKISILLSKTVFTNSQIAHSGDGDFINSIGYSWEH